MKSLKGTGVALVTPLDQNNQVDTLSLARLVNHQIDNGINYLVVLGTTGESITLTQEEKEVVMQTVITANAGRLPLVLGAGGSNTAQVIAAVQEVDTAHFTAVLSVSPAYNKPSQKGVYQHFMAVADASPVPVLLYNVPGRTASNMAVDTVVRLAHDHANIIGIKEAAGDIVAAMKMIKHTPEDFLVISGDDMIAAAMTLAGGAGVISVIAQALPSTFSQMINDALVGNAVDAYKKHYQCEESIDLIFEEGNPAGIKSMLSHLSLCDNELRMPLTKVSPALDKKLAQWLQANKT